MYRSIVVGTDGSPTAGEAVRRAADLALLCEATLTLVSAYSLVSSTAALAMSGGGMGLLVDGATLLEDERAGAEEVLEHALMSLPRTVEPTTVAVAGSAAEVILSVAGERHADLIVIGNRGMGGAQRFLLGSVPSRVSHHAACSVLIVHNC